MLFCLRRFTTREISRKLLRFEKKNCFDPEFARSDILEKTTSKEKVEGVNFYIIIFLKWDFVQNFDLKYLEKSLLPKY